MDGYACVSLLWVSSLLAFCSQASPASELAPLNISFVVLPCSQSVHSLVRYSPKYFPESLYLTPWKLR